MLTFAWRGEADHVHLVRWIHGGADRLPFERLRDTDLWLLRLPVEDGGRFEYKLGVARGGDEELTVDPLNPARAGGSRSARTRWRERSATSARSGACRAARRPAGSRSLRSRAAASARPASVRVYLPAGHDPARPYPLVVVHDGDDFVHYADLPVVLDNLIDAGEIPPVIAALVQTRDRLGEYSGSRPTPAFWSPTCCRRSLRAGGSPRRRGTACCSGRASARSPRSPPPFAIPGVFGGLVLKSGSFILDERKLERRPHPVFHRIARLMRALRRAPDLPRHPRLHLDRRARGARFGEPRACKLLARTRRRCFVQERVGRPPLAQLARPAPRRAAVGAAARRRPDRLTEACPVPAPRGNGGPWRSGPSTSACRSARTSAGRLPTRACSTALDLDLKLGRDRVQLRLRAGDDRAVRPAPAGEVRRGHRPADPLVHDQPRVDQKGDPAQRPLRLQQSLVDPVERKAHLLRRDDAARAADPRDLDAAGQGLRARRRPGADAPAIRAAVLARRRSARRSAIRSS